MNLGAFLTPAQDHAEPLFRTGRSMARALRIARPCGNYAGDPQDLPWLLIRSHFAVICLDAKRDKERKEPQEEM